MVASLFLVQCAPMLGRALCFRDLGAYVSSNLSKKIAGLRLFSDIHRTQARFQESKVSDTGPA